MSKNLERQLGWLSPTGEFIQSDWGEHEETAENIVSDNDWTDEYAEWCKTSKMYECRDYLVYERGYVLINDPELSKKYQLTYNDRLTKFQKDFLYEILIDNGQNILANNIMLL